METMTTSKWLEKVEQSKDKLRSLIENYHPASRQFGRSSLPITAPNAELACDNIRKTIQKEEKEPPLMRWDKALATANVSEILSLLNEAWFGVPESTDCWQIAGFREAVDLMDDPPEEEEEHHDREVL